MPLTSSTDHTQLPITQRQQTPRRFTPSADAPPLRLTGDAAGLQGTNKADSLDAMGQAMDGPGDPRWVLAVRTAELLEGATLRPEKRERLLHLGRMLGLSMFDASLIIAIVQDQARRGHDPMHCPTAAERQLAMIPRPKQHSIFDAFQGRRAWQTAFIITGILAIELILIWWFVM